MILVYEVKTRVLVAALTTCVTATEMTVTCKLASVFSEMLALDTVERVESALYTSYTDAMNSLSRELSLTLKST